MDVEYKGYTIGEYTPCHDDPEGLPFAICRPGKNGPVIVGGTETIQDAMWKIDNHIGIYERKET